MKVACVETKAIRRELCRNCVPEDKKLESHIAVTLSSSSGTTRNRTGDTRIFSPLLYQLSYGTIRCRRASELLSDCKDIHNFFNSQIYDRFFELFIIKQPRHSLLNASHTAQTAPLGKITTRLLRMCATDGLLCNNYPTVYLPSRALTSRQTVSPL